jgi:branched-chain amino acid transport system substrate-binding protein
VFSTGTTTDDTVLVLIRFFREHGWKRLAVISSTDASGQSWDHGVAYAMAHGENKDVSIVVHEHMNPTDISVAGQMTRIKAANPQGILTLATGTPWGTIMRGLNDAGIDLPIGGGNGNMIITQLAQYQSFLPKELYFPGFISIAEHSVLSGPIADAQAGYFKLFRDAGIKPDLGYGIAYDPAMLLIHTLRTLGPQASAQQIRDYILQLHGWAGINGIYDFRDGLQRGVGQRALVIDRWDKSKNEFIPASRPAGYLK